MPIRKSNNTILFKTEYTYYKGYLYYNDNLLIKL